jgi:hypothetical protein
MSRATTQRAQCRYTVKEYGSGQPYIVCELHDPLDLGISEQWSLGFDLPQGTSVDEAQEIARFMQQHLSNLMYTRFTS